MTTATVERTQQWHEVRLLRRVLRKRPDQMIFIPGVHRRHAQRLIDEGVLDHVHGSEYRVTPKVCELVDPAPDQAPSDTVVPRRIAFGEHLAGERRRAVGRYCRTLYELDLLSIRGVMLEIGGSYNLIRHLLLEAGVTLREPLGGRR